MKKEEKKINFKPLNDTILVYAPVISDKTEAGVIKSESMIKEEEKKRDIFLEVAAISDSVVDLKIGDKVLIGNGNHSIFELDGVKLMIVHKLSIVGKRL